jgi:hypothetical protein
MLALAFAAGAAVAATPGATTKAAADTSASTTATADTATTGQAPAKLHKKNKSHAAKHAGARHHTQAKSQHRTSAMGASASTDLEAHTRQERMDAAYAAWQARSR